MCAESLLNYHTEEKFRIFAFCLMPDHLHICAEPTEKSLAFVVGRWKSYVTHRAWKLGWKGRLWQEKFHSKPVLSSKGSEEVLNYVLRNPERAGLAKCWKDWPYWAAPVHGQYGFK
jgi:REP element-mobilizing transposase RayT